MFKGLWFFVKFGWMHEKKYIIYLVLNQFVNSLIPIVAVIMPKYIIDELMNGMRMNYILMYIGILVGYTLVAGVATNYLGWTSFTYRIRVAAEFSIFMNKKTIRIDYADLERSEFINLREKARKFLFGDLHGFSYVLDIAVGIIGKTITITGIIAVVATLNPLLVLLFIILIIVNSYVESRIRKKQIGYTLSLTKNNRRWMYFTEIMENFECGKEIRANNLGDWLIKQKIKFMDKSYLVNKKSNKLGIKGDAFTTLTSFIQQGIAYVYLSIKVIQNAITIGEFTMYVGGVIAFAGAMRSVMSSIIEVSQFRQYYDAMEEYLNVPVKMRDNKHLPIPDGNHMIEFRNVSFKYWGSDEYAVRNINLVLNPKVKLSVVGENGAGKTTFIKLLCRIYDPTEGEILLDGVDIKDIDYDEYMSLFSTVFQDFKLFSFSIKENVALSQSAAATDEDVISVLKDAGLGDKIDSLPDGIHTFVYKNYDDEGFEPSGGEGQKIALARALYKNAPIVILDEPTAALDPKAEYAMYMNFDRLAYGKTAVYISHRLASTRFCDNIAVFHKGKIAEYGTHQELLKNDGVYAGLYTMQAELYRE